MTLFCFILSIFRCYVTETKVFLFLNWNLFLAWIPFIISSFLYLFNRKNSILLLLTICVWILFFPNSPYILTDLFHLKGNSEIPIWYDLLIILSYAWTALFCGFLSLLDIERLLHEYFCKTVVDILTVLFLFLSSFGVYLGRFLRWNSWDIFQHPSGLLNDIIVRIIYPREYTSTWGVTILMGIMLNFMYFMIKNIKKSPISFTES
ncbi:MAG: DUF1361 domain-containing protein [Chryseobacterium taeanense]